MSFSIAIDGHAASGKGTLAKGVAKHFGFSYLDTGLIYRAVARMALLKGDGQLNEVDAIAIARSFKTEYLNMDNLRSSASGSNASWVASIPQVRTALVEFQREFAEKGDGAILDGRDIATVILPNAALKIFVTADLNVRAERRYTDFLNTENNISQQQVRESLAERDFRDSNRQHSPLKISNNAHLIDTTELSIEAAIARAIELVRVTKQKP
jgi:cytidylate kinase